MSFGLALLVSADAGTIRTFSHALQEFCITPDVCGEAAAAIHRLGSRKFDAVLVDLKLGEASGAILDEVHHSDSNRTAVTFAISGDDAALAAASRKRSSFVFEKPVSPQTIRRTLRSAYGMILRERRRYFRCPVTLPVVLRREHLPDLHCESVNLSQGGMALNTAAALVPGNPVQVEFTVPGHAYACRAEGTIRWSKTGHIGVHFSSIPQECELKLQEWLSQKLEETLPEFVSRQFEKQNRGSEPGPGREH